MGILLEWRFKGLENHGRVQQAGCGSPGEIVFRGAALVEPSEPESIDWTLCLPNLPVDECPSEGHINSENPETTEVPMSGLWQLVVGGIKEMTAAAKPKRRSRFAESVRCILSAYCNDDGKHLIVVMGQMGEKIAIECTDAQIEAIIGDYERKKAA